MEEMEEKINELHRYADDFNLILLYSSSEQSDDDNLLLSFLRKVDLTPVTPIYTISRISCDIIGISEPQETHVRTHIDELESYFNISKTSMRKPYDPVLVRYLETNALKVDFSPHIHKWVVTTQDKYEVLRTILKESGYLTISRNRNLRGLDKRALSKYRYIVLTCKEIKDRLIYIHKDDFYLLRKQLNKNTMLSSVYNIKE